MRVKLLALPMLPILFVSCFGDSCENLGACGSGNTPGTWQSSGLKLESATGLTWKQLEVLVDKFEVKNVSVIDEAGSEKYIILDSLVQTGASIATIRKDGDVENVYQIKCVFYPDNTGQCEVFNKSTDVKVATAIMKHL